MCEWINYSSFKKGDGQESCQLGVMNRESNNKQKLTFKEYGCSGQTTSFCCAEAVLTQFKLHLDSADSFSDQEKMFEIF